jgi:hypothetical protein
MDILHDFTERNNIEVHSTMHGAAGMLVYLVHSAGSLRFQFNMRPEQARQLAQALTQHADKLEKLQ